ncbi:MAG: trypsin-like peptidase domain-containing protein [Patescibacteria group bacterium]|nr:trypsin-like peptidase domain-containing protein [Patescibacteria group bacterium]
MSLYDLPKIELPKIKIPKFWPNRRFWLIILTVFISSFFGFLAGAISINYLYSEIKEQLSKINIEIPGPRVIEKIIEKQPIIQKEYQPQTSEEEKIIQVVKEVSPAVVSIIITKDIKILEEYWISPFEEFPFQIPEYRERIEKKEIGGGTGFIVSEDGMILTNKHVVLDEKADYTVFTIDGRKFPAKVLAKDSVQDTAIIKIEQEKIVDQNGKLTLKPFPTVKLGDSDKLQIGQTVIAIGNVLGEFRNSVSVGVISGLGRTITASGGGLVETIEDVIQTDAAINKGNSGGPLLNLKGEVMGINTAMVLEAQNVGFAIPINKAKKDIEQVKKFGKIVYPYLGIWYFVITDELQKEKDLPVNYGAWITRWNRDQYGGWYLMDRPAVVPGSAADKAGLKENDIILEWDGEKITIENHLRKIIMKYNPGDKVVLKILRNKQEKIFRVTLGERSE